MAAACAWLSVVVKRGQQIVKPRSAVRCSWDDSFSTLVDADCQVLKIEISKTEKFIDPVIIPIDAPISLCEQFGCYHVCIDLVEPPTDQVRVVSTLQPQNAFDVMMSAAKEVSLPPHIVPPEGRNL